MNKRKLFTGFTAAAIAAGMIIPAAGSAFAGPVFASVREENLRALDVIDDSKTGSITIYKYDITSAEKDGIYQKGEREASGTRDSAVEEKLSGYAVSGVKYAYARLGKAETSSVTNGSDSSIGVVYEIPKTVADILGLAEADAVDMKNQSVSAPCDGEGGALLHFSSTVIDSAVRSYLEEDNISAKNALETYMTERGTDGILTTDDKGMAHAEDLPLGLYLLVEMEVPENVEVTTDPWFISLPYTYNAGDVHGDNGDITGSDDAVDASKMAGNNWAYDIYCYPKNQTGKPVLEGKFVRNAAGVLAEEPGKGEGDEYIVTELEREGFTSERQEYTYAESTTASEGDVLDYIIVTKLPHIENKATYLTEYSFEDILSEGITYNHDAKIAIYDNRDDALVNNTVKALDIWAKDDCFTAAYSSSTEYEGASVMDTALNEKGLEKVNTTGLSDHYLVLYYTAVVNSDDSVILGDTGNKNDITMTWRRTNTDYADTYTHRSYVYSFALNLKKEFRDGEGDASNVQFILYNDSDGYYICAEKEDNEDGIYHITGKSDKKEDAAKLSPDKDGVMKVYGLEADSYLLTETATDKGFSLLKDPVNIVIRAPEEEGGHAGAAVDGVEADMEADSRSSSDTSASSDETDLSDNTDSSNDTDSSYIISKHAVVKMTVENTKSFTLPQTGGNGMYAVTVTGAVSIAAGCFIMSRKKKS